MEVATSSLRSKLSASFRAWWETASRPLRIFTVGGSTVGVSVLLIQVSGPDRLIFGLMAAGGILLTAAFLLDLYHAALVIEVDGNSHATDEGIEHDRVRHAYLKSLGLMVVRFWNTEVSENSDGILEYVCELCAKRQGMRRRLLPRGETHADG